MAYTADKEPTGLTAKTTPVDADVVIIGDSADATEVAKKVTWSNVKATLKAYFDTLYAAALGADDNYVTDAEKTVIGNTSGTNTGDETAARIGVIVNASSAATPNDTDLVTTVESSVVKKITWTNVKAFLKTYFDTLYLALAGGTLTGTLTLAENAKIALDPAGSADGKFSGITVAGTAGTTLAFGDLVYLAAADSRWELADADAASTADRMMGMCVLAAASDGDATVILLQGIIRADAAFPALTIGSPVYVGETAGDVQTAIPTGADNVIRKVGFAMTADELYFNPSMDVQVTVA